MCTSNRFIVTHANPHIFPEGGYMVVDTTGEANSVHVGDWDAAQEMRTTMKVNAFLTSRPNPVALAHIKVA